jgi:hypothetical protein
MTYSSFSKSSRKGRSGSDRCWKSTMGLFKGSYRCSKRGRRGSLCKRSREIECRLLHLMVPLLAIRPALHLRNRSRREGKVPEEEAWLCRGCRREGVSISSSSSPNLQVVLLPTALVWL